MHYGTPRHSGIWQRPDDFRGVFDLHEWAPNGRDPWTGEIHSPLGPDHVRQRRANGLIDNRTQIAHRMAWWILQMRRHAGMTQQSLADHMETAQSSVSKWETGRTLMSLDTLSFISDLTESPVALYFDIPGYPQEQRAMWL